MKIPYDQLSPEALRGVIESFILREGTDYGDYEYSLDEKIEQIMSQLKAGKVHITYDEETNGCNIVTAD